ncbi:MAG: DUF3883 domain-containing protein [Gammaproteobacteria bacterium]
MPIRDFGLPFVVQGDFLLSSSREDIHREWLWNVRIRDEIAEAFVRALPKLRASHGLATTFLELVPDVDQIADPFFQEAARQVCARLSSEPCVLTVSGTWKKPGQILLAGEEFRQLFGNDSILQCLGLEYASEEFSARARKTLAKLGAVECRLTHLASLLDTSLLIQKLPASWFTRLYRFMASCVIREPQLTLFKGAHFIRTADGSEKALGSGSIFFPLRRGKRYGFEGELTILDPAILEGDEEDVAAARKFLERLGVAKASAHAITFDHILKRHKSDGWKSSTAEARVGHVRYIKDHLQELTDEAVARGGTAADAREQLAEGLFLRTQKTVGDTLYYGRPKTLYLPPEYLPPVSMKQLLGAGAESEIFIGEEYLSEDPVGSAGRSAPDSARDWRDFFFAIGVNQFPAVNPVPGTTTDIEAGPHLTALLGSTDPGTVTGALQIIDRSWHHYSQFQYALRWDGRAISQSRFIATLRDTRTPVRGREAVPLSETYVSSDVVRAVFGEAPPYLTIDLTNTDFMDAVGITRQVDATACFKRLDQLREATRGSAKTMQLIYRALEGRFPLESGTVSSGFEVEARIYIPVTRTWHARDQVVWESGGALLDSLYPPLERAYRDHRTFFCEQLEVARQPTENALLEALLALSAQQAPLEAKQRDAFHIYKRLAAVLNEGLEADPAFAPDWLSRLKSEALFLDHVGRLVSRDNDLYVDDDLRLAELFRSYNQISLLGVDRARTAVLQSLLNACGVPSLSSSVELRLTSVRDASVDRELTSRLRTRAASIARLVFHRDHALYERGVRGEVWSTLRRLEVQRVSGVDVEARLGEFVAQATREVFRDGQTLYLHREARSARDKLCEEVCAYIGARPEVADSLYRVLFAESDQDVVEFLEAKHIPEMPAEEAARWRAGLWTSRETESERDYSDRDVDDWLEMQDEAPPQAEGSSDERVVRPQSPHEVDGGPAELDPDSGQQHRSGASHSDLTGVPRNDVDDASGASGDAEVGNSGSIESGGLSGIDRQSEQHYRPGRDQRQSGGRLLSYAEPHHSEETVLDESSLDQREIRAVAEAAVAFVMEEERRAGHLVREMPFNNEGFDILRTVDGMDEEYVEVKGLRGPWTEAGLVMTTAELRHAERFRSRYFLYVVEFACDPARRALHRIQDPYGKIAQFRFDSGWKSTAITQDVLEPVIGMRIELPGAVGHIRGVRRMGQFFSLEVQVGDGPPTKLVFVPGKMRLYRE